MCYSTKVVVEGALAQYRLIENSEIEEQNSDLVQYLYQEDYLENKLECPLGGIYILEEGEVICDHCDTQ